MADSRLKEAIDDLSAGPVAGESLADVRRRGVRKLAGALDDILNVLSDTVSWGVQGSSEVQVRHWIAPFDLQILSAKAVYTGTVTNTPLLAINNRKQAGGGSNLNVLSTATQDLAALFSGGAANEPEALTLSATAANLLVKAGDALTFTLTTDGTEDHDGISVAFTYKPIVSAD